MGLVSCTWVANRVTHTCFYMDAPTPKTYTRSRFPLFHEFWQVNHFCEWSKSRRFCHVSWLRSSGVKAVSSGGFYAPMVNGALLQGGSNGMSAWPAFSWVGARWPSVVVEGYKQSGRTVETDPFSWAWFSKLPQTQRIFRDDSWSSGGAFDTPAFHACTILRLWLLLVKPGNPKARRVPKVGENHPNSQKTDWDNVSNKDWSEVFRFNFFFETPTRPCSLHPLLTRMPPTATVDWYSQGLFGFQRCDPSFFLKRWPMTIFPFPIFIGGSIQIPRFPDDGSYPISNHVTSAQARENVEVLRRCQATHKSTINNMWWRVTLHEKMSMLIHTLHAVEILSQRWGRDLISLATPLRTFRDKT